MNYTFRAIINNFVTALDAIVVLVPLFVVGTLASVLFSYLYSRSLRERFLRSIMVFLTFSSFGSTVGMFMGASSQPIVASVLPPVITLVSGYLAFVKSANLPLKTRVLVPGALVLMLGMLQYSAWYVKLYLNPPTREIPMVQEDPVEL